MLVMHWAKFPGAAIGNTCPRAYDERRKEHESGEQTYAGCANAFDVEMATHPKADQDCRSLEIHAVLPAPHELFRGCVKGGFVHFHAEVIRLAFVS